MKTKPYRNRREAGRILAEHVKRKVGASAALVIALTRGGVPVGFEVACALGAPLDVFVVRKLGVPGREDVAMGAIAADGSEFINVELVAKLGISPLQIAASADREREELQRSEECFRAGRAAVEARGRRVIVVDDGLDTGASMRAVLEAMRRMAPRELIVATPVGTAKTCGEIAREVDALICPLQPAAFADIGEWYEDFSPTTDTEVCEYLVLADENERAAEMRDASAAAGVH